MENNIDQEIAVLAYQEVKKELQQKVGIFALCMAIFFAFFKLAFGETSFFSALGDSFMMTLAMYLPFKIVFKFTGSVVGGIVGGLILGLIISAVLGGNSILLSLVLLGGLVLDFGWSIAKLLKIRSVISGK